ncbi:MAG: hypothetical protein ABJZ55_02805 [Fuerstiella sp.]
MKDEQQPSNSRLFFAAAKVLIRRPAALLIGLSLLILIAMLIEAIPGDSRTVSGSSNTPDLEPSGRKLTFAEDWRTALQDDQPNLRVSRLRFDFLDIHPVAGESGLFLGDIGDDPDSEFEPNETTLTKRLGTITRMFPNTQWISLREEHLDSLPFSEFSSFKNLDSVEFTTDTLTTKHLVQLSRLPKIHNLTLEATWCEADLGELAAMKNLESLRLEARDIHRERSGQNDNAEKLITVNHVAQLSELPKLKLLSLNDEGELLGYASNIGLSPNNLPTYEQFVESIQNFPSLKALYVGEMARPFGDKLLFRTRADLPNLSIQPTTYDSEMAFFMGLVGLTMFAGLFVATSHAMMSNSLEQNCLLTGAQKGHLKVYFLVAAILMTLSVFVVMLNTFADLFSIVTLELAVLGLTSSLSKPQPGMYRKASPPESAPRQFHALLFLPLTGLVLFVWIGNIFFGARVAEYFCGHDPIWCLALTACSVVLIFHNAQSLLTVHRLWAENGLCPSTSWRELQASLAMQQHQILQRAVEARQLKTGKRASDSWSKMLQVIVVHLRRNPTSFLTRCRLWMAALTPMAPRKTIICFTVVVPLIVSWPLLWQVFTEGANDLVNMRFILTLLFTEFLMVGAFVVMTWHGRQAMYETEILRPIRRRVWRKTVFSSLLATVGILSSIVWGQIHILHWLFSFDFDSAWISLSLISLLSAIVFATAAFLLGLIAQRIIFAALLVLIGLAAYVPMGIIMAAQVSETPALDFPSFPTLLVISIIEFVAGAIILNTAWKRWAKLEVATL